MRQSPGLGQGQGQAPVSEPQGGGEELIHRAAGRVGEESRTGESEEVRLSTQDTLSDFITVKNAKHRSLNLDPHFDVVFAFFVCECFSITSTFSEVSHLSVSEN